MSQPIYVPPIIYHYKVVICHSTYAFLSFHKRMSKFHYLDKTSHIPFIYALQVICKFRKFFSYYTSPYYNRRKIYKLCVLYQLYMHINLQNKTTRHNLEQYTLTLRKELRESNKTASNHMSHQSPKNTIHHAFLKIYCYFKVLTNYSVQLY